MNYTAHISQRSGCGPLLAGDITRLPALRQQVFEHIRSAGRAARADITRELNISGASTTALTADLIEAGFLREVDQLEREQGRGRPRVALEVVPEASYVIGIKLSFQQHSAVLCNFAGDVLARATLPTQSKRCSEDVLLEQIITLCHRVINAAEMRTQDISAVGVGIPGIVDQASGKISWCSLLQKTNVDLVTAFAAKFDAPLFLDNDTNMLTLAELWFGLGRDKTDFAVVTIENGVGMGLVLNNRLYRGTHGVGLELGHTKVQFDGALCRCGQRGCLEAYLGDYALTREAGTALDHDDTMQKDNEELLDLLFEKAKAGHSAAETIFRRAGRYLSVGLSNVVQLFDPPLIIISGHRMRFDYFHSDEVLAEMRKLTLSKSRQPCQIETHAWDDLVWARGAAVPALVALTDQLIGGLGAHNT